MQKEKSRRGFLFFNFKISTEITAQI